MKIAVSTTEKEKESFVRKAIEQLWIYMNRIMVTKRIKKNETIIGGKK